MTKVKEIKEKFKCYGAERFHYDLERDMIVYTKKGKKEDEEYNIYNGILTVNNAMKNLDTDEVEVEVFSIIQNKPYKAIIPQYSLTTGGNDLLKALAVKDGFMIDPRYTKQIVEYLFAQYKGRKFANKLKVINTSKKIGFLRNNKNEILSFILPEDMSISLDDGKYRLKEDNHLYKNIIQKGSTKEWFENVFNPIYNHGTKDATALMMCAFGCPVSDALEIHEQFVADMFGNSGTGKTSVSNGIASIYGKPNRMLTNWNTTINGLVSKAVEHGSLPVIMDDTKKCTNKELLNDAIYLFSDGKDRTRANQDGSAREEREFKSILISTGEVSMLDYASKSGNSGLGAFNRVLTFEYPFKKCQENKIIVDKLNESCKKYYGSVGLDWIRYLCMNISNEDTLEDWKREYDEIRVERCSVMKQELSSRRANHMALVEFTMNKFWDCFSKYLPKLDIKEYFNDLYDKLEENSKEVDPYVNAYEYINEYVLCNLSRFYTDKNKDTIIKDVIGEIKKDRVYFYMSKQLEEELQNFGDYKDILKKFKERGLLECNNKGLKKANKPFDSDKVVNQYCIRLDIQINTEVEDLIPLDLELAK